MTDESHGSPDVLERVDAGDEFVEVMFARSAEQANGAVGYLAQREIPARVESNAGLSPDCGVAVLVPSARLMSASEILAARTDDEEETDDSDDSEEFEDEIDDDEDDEPEDFDDEDEDEDDDEDFDDEELDEDEEF